MSFRSVAAKNVVLRIVGVMTVAGAALVTVSVTNESFYSCSVAQDCGQACGTAKGAPTRRIRGN